MTETLILLLADRSPNPVERTVIDYCEGSETVSVHTRLGGSVNYAPGTLTFSLNEDDRTQANWYLTDSSGSSLTTSKLVVDAVRWAEPAIEVQLRDRSGTALAAGRVATRRTAELTRRQMRRVAGPLITMACSQPRPSEEHAGSGTPSISLLGLLPGDMGGLTRFAGRLLRAAITRREWSVARLRDGQTIEMLLDDGGLASSPRRHVRGGLAFWADPCVLVADGRESLFVEEFDLRTGRGRIRHLACDADGTPVPGSICLSTMHHLSFPQVYPMPDGWLATVETCASVNPIYWFRRPGDRWEPTNLPALPGGLADPVLLQDESGGVTGVVATDARTDPNAVVTVHRLRGKRWLRDDAATYIDVQLGRGGGTLDTHRGLRAVQDCSRAYGRAVLVTRWPQRPPTPIMRLDAESIGSTGDTRRPAGWHTLSWSTAGDIVWCDAWRRKPSLLGGAWRVVERLHSSRCRG